MIQKPLSPLPKFNFQNNLPRHLEPKQRVTHSPLLKSCEDFTKLEEENSTIKLTIPDRKEVQSRTHEPDIDDLIFVTPANQATLEETWGQEKPVGRQLGWRWPLFIFGILCIFILWIMFGAKLVQQLNGSDKLQAALMNHEPNSRSFDQELVLSDWKKNQSANQQIEDMTKTIQSFFSATRIEELQLLIRQPERVYPLVIQYYQNHPLTAKKISSNIPSYRPLLNSESDKNFWVATCESAQHEPFKVVLEISPSGKCQVDWETIVHLQPMDWNDFVEKRPNSSSVDFRLSIQEDDYFTAEFPESEMWRCYKLTARDSDHILYGYVRAGSQLAREMSDRTAADQGKYSSVILRLKIPPNINSKRGVLIEKMVSPYWVYIDPPISN